MLHPDLNAHLLVEVDTIARPIRPTAKGKFLFAGDKKFYVKGVTYGAFRPDDQRREYWDYQRIEADFAQMAANGLNAVRIPHTIPPRSLLDAAQRHGLRVMVGLSAEQFVGYLIDRERAPDIEEIVRTRVRAVADHPALLCYAIGNEIPASVARWLGRRRVERYLHRIYRAIKQADPSGLVTYVNYPSTEYLDLPFLDIVSFNVYLESEERLKAYLARLHNIAGDRPLIMSELGLDGLRNGALKQAEVLDWQVRTTFSSGCAGAFIFAWTDEWHRAGEEVGDWEFGVTRRDRSPKPSLPVLRKAFSEVPFSYDLFRPRISVVVCSFNGSRTINECLQALSKVRYPDFEVLVVDDGSTDNTAAIAAQYDVKLIRTPNQGLSQARNVGWQAANGEIVAYIDDDAYPDPDWLGYLAETFRKADYAGVGGPNIPPREDGFIAACVANAPGGPAHVLLTDTDAEHIPGCNMAFLRSALEAVGGFDVQFRTAGDDVDICWRLQERGWKLGFSPSAVVWHHRRNLLRTFWRQQRGYGKAEALLEKKWPQKYNSAGHPTWRGRVYDASLASFLGTVTRVYHGRWGSAPFQSLYETGPNAFLSLFAIPEWYLVSLALATISVLGGLWSPLLIGLPLLAVSVGLPIANACANASRSRFPLQGYHFLLKALTAFLHLFQPAARLYGRLAYGLEPWRSRLPGCFVLPLPRKTAAWTTQWEAAEGRLAKIQADLQNKGIPVRPGGQFDSWDLEIVAGFCGGARLLMAVEDHGAGAQYVRSRVWPKCSTGYLSVTFIVICLSAAAALDGAWLVSALLGVAALLLIFMSVRHYGAATAALLQAIAHQTGDVPATAMVMKGITRIRHMSDAQTNNSQEAMGSAGRASTWAWWKIILKRNLRDLVGARSNLYMRIIQQTRPYWLHLVGVFLLSLLASPLALLGPLPLKLIVDSAIGTSPLPWGLEAVLPQAAEDKSTAVLVLAAVLVVGLGLLLRVQEMMTNMLGAYTAEKLVLDLRARLFQHSQRLSISYHDQKGSADALHRIQSDAIALRYITIDGFIPLVSAGFTLIGMIYVTARMNWRLALVAVAVSPILFVLSMNYRPLLRHKWAHVRELESSASSIVHEVLGALRVVQAFGREDHEYRRYVERTGEGMSARLHLAWVEGRYGLLVGITMALGTAAVLVIGAGAVRAGSLSLGELLLVIAYVGQLYDPLRTIGRKSASLQGHLASIDRAFHLLD
jgi:GT2 family glycosyltransferase